MTWDGSNGNWTGRVTGSMSDFASFLQSSVSKTMVFRTERGTTYGPFTQGDD